MPSAPHEQARKREGPLWVRLGRADHLLGARIRDRCSPVSGPIRGGRIGAALGQLWKSLCCPPFRYIIGCMGWLGGDLRDGPKSYCTAGR